MRKGIIALATLAALGMLLGLGSGCRKKNEQSSAGQEKVTARQVKQKTGEALRAVREYTIQEKEEYQRQMEAKLTEFDQKITILKAKAEKTGDEARATLHKKLRRLQKREKLARQKLAELKNAGGQVWGDLKALLDQTATRIEKSIERLGTTPQKQ